MVTNSIFLDTKRFSRRRSRRFSKRSPEEDSTANETSHAEDQVSELKIDSSPTAGFCNHIMINNLRRDHYSVHALVRSRELDEIAREHAAYMARKQVMVHAVEDESELQDKLRAKTVGSNVQRGVSVQVMHEYTLRTKGEALANLVSSQFTELGMGTAQGSDGKLYLCQLFRNPE